MTDEEWNREEDDEDSYLLESQMDDLQEDLYCMQEQLNYMAELYEAPILMTHKQYAYFILDDYTDSLVRLLKGSRNSKADFNEDFWSPLSEKDVVRAWLNPSIIRIEED